MRKTFNKLAETHITQRQNIILPKVFATLTWDSAFAFTSGSHFMANDIVSFELVSLDKLISSLL